MPILDSLSGFVGEEVDRFQRGLDGVSGRDRERIQKDLQRRGITPGTAREMSIPQWEDVVHYKARTPITADDRFEWRLSRREERAPNLPPDVILEMARRENRIESFRRSAQPEYAQSWGAMLTAMDNVQDFLASVSVGGRVVTKIGAKVGLRFIPGVGWVQNAADVLNVSMFIGQLGLVGFAGLCHGPRAFLETGIATGMVRAGGKGLVSLLAGVNPAGRVWRTKTPPAIALRLGYVGAGLVVLQTTDQLFGYGVSLGPLVGYTMESVYQAERQRRGEPVRFAPTPQSEEWWNRAHPHLATIPTVGLETRAQAAGALRMAAPLSATQETFRREEHLGVLLALHAGLPMLRKDVEATRWWEWPMDADSLVIPPSDHAVDATHDELLYDAGPPPESFAWPGLGRPGGATARELTALYAPKITATVADLVRPIQYEPLGVFFGVLVNEVAEALWLLLARNPDTFQFASSPDQLLLERLTAVNLLLHPGQDEAPVWAMWTEARRMLEDHGKALLAREEWRALARKHGVDLILMRPPDVRDRPGPPPGEQPPALPPATA